MQADGGADASIIRSWGEMVPEGAPVIKSGVDDPRPDAGNCRGENMVDSDSSPKGCEGGRSKKSDISDGSGRSII